MRGFRIARRGLGRFGFAIVVFLAAACTGADTGSPVRQFEVAYVSPPDGFVLDDQPETIQFIFTRTIDPGSVNDRSIRLVCENGLEVLGERQVTLLTPATVTFVPAHPLERGKEYFAIASTDVRDEDGRPLAAAHSSVLALASPNSGTPGPGPGGGSTGVCAEPIGRTIFAVRNERLIAVDSQNGNKPFTPVAVASSSRLHDCQRWYLEWAASTLTTPDGEPARGIRARSGDGQLVTLLPPDANRGIDANDFPVRWGPDDSFFSFVAIEWVAGDATSSIVRIPLTWESGKPAADPAGEIKLAPSPVLGPGDSAIHVFDWSPSGERLVFSRWLVGLQQHQIYLVDAASGSTSFLVVGERPAWCPVGPDSAAPIVYEDYAALYPGIYTIHADGTDKTLVTPNWKSTGGNMRREWPVWSPDGNRIAVIRTEAGVPAGGTRTWAVELLHLTLETIDELTDEQFDFLLAWR